LNVPVTELYYITGGGAPISLQSRKWSQKHGGFSRLLTPEWRHWSQILVVITTGQPRSSDSDDNFTPLDFGKAWNSAESLYKKTHQEKMPSFAWLHDATILYQENTLLFTGKMYY
jgi:hypothetical protein